MNGPDYLGLPSQEQRVFSFPASQSLHASGASATAKISTGLAQLDKALTPPGPEPMPESTASKGLPSGHVAEIFGPPGAGKTSLALNIAANVLRDEERVVWIDAGSPLPRKRLREMLSGAKEGPPSKSPEELMHNLTYFRARSLPHLLALLTHPPHGFPPKDTKLLVIDSVSEPFPAYFPNPTELRTRLAEAKVTDNAQIQWLMNRKWNVTSELANYLVKLATTHRLVALVVDQTHTRIKGQPRPMLCPVLAGGTWENGVYTRIVVYRDFPAGDSEEVAGRIRFAEVMKRGGKALSVRVEENIVPFVVETDGLRGVEQNVPSHDAVQVQESAGALSTSQRKRKVDEVADSQDEDSDEEFGWVEGDDPGLLGKD
ncbi:P-loop containing nucleoside triphosphate hydrolase protein [Aspergillus campestris IBT 28561]|uniref:DNA repair protein RAD51 homolog 3 n=1 Tax=Aspergillus campestris (strain IBT 28561) TaxID=1392248 RepID=A0A2I1D4Z3_ASPC2|nr:P-loop containing nucleoside triphosphate hydrolase protein [Aspergillus campestris IBT 28561]PKY04939.1 P-loop containing nucleoside triphosphate hydrolase protein [Aspergillus campestris IBT 28561]